MSSDYASTRQPDLTMTRPMPGVGLSMKYRYVRCDHDGQRKGGTFANNVPMRCPACTAARKAAKA